MPLNKDLLLRYKILDECFRDTFNYYDMNLLYKIVNKEVMLVYDKTVSKRSIQNDVKRLQYPPYNVEFDEELRKMNYYRYADPDFKLEIVQSLSKREQTAIQETIKLLRPIVEDVEKSTPLQYYMHLCLQHIANGNTIDFDFPSVDFENNELLAGMEHFDQLVQSVINKQPLKIIYRAYHSKTDLEFKIHPYLLKQYNGRWYLLSHTEGYNNISNYPIDRIRKIKIWKTAFKQPVIDLKEHFRYTIGVSVTNTPIERIVLKISNSRYPYVETKPFSEEQKIVSYDNENHFITFPMRINKEFVSQLLSFGCDIEVIEPEILRDDIKEQVKKMNQKYIAVQKDCMEEV